mgnify:CR=1 FL=1
MIEICKNGSFPGAIVLHHVAPDEGSPGYLILDRKAPDGGRYTVSDETETAFVPACCVAPEGAEAAHQLYAAYNRGGPAERAGLAWDGREVPTWEQLLERGCRTDGQANDLVAAGVIAKWRGVASLMADTRPVIRLAIHAEGLAALPVGAEVHHPVHGPGRVVVSADWAWIEEYPTSRATCDRIHAIPTLAELGVGNVCPVVNAR